MDDDVLTAAVGDLAADYERLGNPLEIARVERLALARRLSFEQTNALFEALVARGIPVVDPEVEVEPSELTSREGASAADDETWCRRMLDHPLLDAKKERELARTILLGAQASEEWASGNHSEGVRKAIQRGEDAREKMARCNFRLVWQLARRYASITGLDTVDLFQDGNLGLLKAIEKFNPDQGTRFSTYATWWIRQAVTRAAIDSGRTIRFPVHIHQSVIQLTRATTLLWREKGRRPTLKDLADELAWELERVAFIEALASAKIVPIDARDEADEERLSLYEVLPDSGPGPEELAEKRQERDVIERALSHLAPQEREILTWRSGLDGAGPKTLEAISRVYGLTRERVRQIEAKAIERVRPRLRQMLDGVPRAISEHGSGIIRTDPITQEVSPTRPR